MNQFCIKTTTGPKQHRGVQVSVSHSKDRKAFVASAYPYMSRPDQTILISLCDIDFKNQVDLASARVNYAKQRKNWEANVEYQLKERQGFVWDLVLRVCDQFGLKVLPSIGVDSKEIPRCLEQETKT